ncbi:Armadillo-type fold [Artemisia annua]|uniref:Armadillo-type fold n=1 Tax=Artemisia annua TaxID=35608 RepID=A0A2U1PEG1_ARTAN|nr:Armadillo-type fold [Artemisia annua]
MVAKGGSNLVLGEGDDPSYPIVRGWGYLHTFMTKDKAVAEERADKGLKKLSKDGKKTKDGKTISSKNKGNGSDENRVFPAVSQAGDKSDTEEDDDDVQWQTNTSAAAARRRIQEQLNTVDGCRFEYPTHIDMPNYRSDDQRFFFGPTTDTTSVTDKETHRSTELTATATLSLTNLTEDTPPNTDRKTSIVTRSIKIEKPTGLRSNEKSAKPSKKLKIRITFDGQSPLEAGQSKEVSNTPINPSGDVKNLMLVVKPVRQLRDG